MPSMYVVNADGTGLTSLGPSYGQVPSFSPDGTKIAFTAGNGVRVANTDGTGMRQIAQNQDGELAWSPDGAIIAVATGLALVFLDPNATDEFCPRGGCPPPTGDPPRTITGPVRLHIPPDLVSGRVVPGRQGHGVHTGRAGRRRDRGRQPGGHRISPRHGH